MLFPSWLKIFYIFTYSNTSMFFVISICIIINNTEVVMTSAYQWTGSYSVMYFIRFTGMKFICYEREEISQKTINECSEMSFMKFKIVAGFGTSKMSFIVTISTVLQTKVSGKSVLINLKFMHAFGADFVSSQGGSTNRLQNTLTQKVRCKNVRKLWLVLFHS